MIITKNISEQTYLHIRETLLISDVYVGQKILHNELGKKLGISQTPLREALFRLAAEGLLQHESYKGFSVSAITSDETREVYEVRELIEPLMAEKAAMATMTAKDELFTEFYAYNERFISEPYTRGKLLIDKKFHMKIANLAGNHILAETLNFICDKLIFKSVFERISPERGEQIVAEHSEILKALEEKDGAKAAELMKNHIIMQKHFLMTDIDRNYKGKKFFGDFA